MLQRQDCWAQAVLLHAQLAVACAANRVGHSVVGAACDLHLGALPLSNTTACACMHTVAVGPSLASQVWKCVIYCHTLRA